MVASQETDRITVPWNSRPRDSSEWTKHGFGTFSAVYEHEHSHGREPSRYRTNREDRRQFHHCRSHTPTISKGQSIQRSLRYESSTFHLRCAWFISITQLCCSREMSVSRCSRCYLWYKILKLANTTHRQTIDEHKTHSHTGAGGWFRGMVGGRLVVIDAEAHDPPHGPPRASITGPKVSSWLNEATLRRSFSFKRSFACRITHSGVFLRRAFTSSDGGGSWNFLVPSPESNFEFRWTWHVSIHVPTTLTCSYE